MLREYKMQNDHIWNAKKHNMMKSLNLLCGEIQSPPPAPELWPKTRQLADACNESIYTARLLLLALEKEGKVLCTHRSVHNSLRWYVRA
jgi:hypothetical protein